MKTSSRRIWWLLAGVGVLLILLTSLLILETNKKNAKYEMAWKATIESSTDHVVTAIAASMTAKSYTSTPAQ